MNKPIVIGLALGMALTLVGSVFAAGPGIYQREAANGAVELSNVGNEDEGSQLLMETPRPDVKPASATRNMTDSTAVVAPAVDAPKSAVQATNLPTAPVATTSSDSPEVLASRLAQYRQSMLNPPLLPNGRPANPAIQRRYLMVKKSDYVSGN